MPFSIRFDPDTEAIIERLARTRSRSRASVVREAVAHYAAQALDDRPLYARMAQHLGTVSSTGSSTVTGTVTSTVKKAMKSADRGRLSEETGQAFAKIVKAKARARRAR